MSEQLFQNLPECPGCGATLARCTEPTSREKGALACCPDCQHETPVEIDYEAMETYLHASIWSMFQDELIPTRPKIEHLVRTLVELGIEGDDDEEK